MGNEIKKDYSHSLLSLSSSRRIIGGSPLAFGGENTNGRIKNILDYKKPRFWATLVGSIVIVVASIGLLSNPKDQIAKDSQALIKGFLDNYYAQLSYSQEEIEEVQQEMEELGTIIGLGQKIRKEPSEEVKPDGFYYFYKEALSPELYSTMVSNRKIPNWKMMETGFEKSKVKNLKLKKEKDIIYASFKVDAYLQKIVAEQVFEVDFQLKQIEGKMYIDRINGELAWSSGR